MADERTPVIVLTGFLGSGKSTLLSGLVREPGMERSVAIVNEFGEVGLDHLLVTRGGEDTVLLDSGCLCCLGSGAIQDTLMLLAARRQRGEIPDFDRVFVETSGLADPAPLMQPLLADAMLRRKFRLARMVAIADAVRIAGQSAGFAEARRQLAFADRIVVSKCDLATPGQLAESEALLRRFNTTAEVVRSAFGKDGRLMLGSALLGLDGGETPRPAAQDGPQAHHHTHGIVSRSYRDIAPTSWQAYAQALANLRAVDGAQLLRCKGVLRFPEGPCVVQGVQHVFSPPAPINADVAPFLVAIVHDLAPERLDLALAPLLKKK